MIAHMVTRNEAGRYLQAVLAALSPWVDVVHVYDDLSTDATVRLALDYTARVTRRPPLVPSFAEDESRFREAGWRAMEESLWPCTGDWVLAIDADEILAGAEGIDAAIDAAEEAGACAVSLPIPEVFALVRRGTGLVPMIRTDGFWRGLAAPRLVAFEPGAEFRRQPLAGGSVPSYVSAGAHVSDNHGVELLHLGYVELADRAAKHARYAGVPGHNAEHVASILRTPFLQPWHGGEVRVWRGFRG